MHNSPLDFVAHGGFMMIPLLLSGLVSLTFIFERLYTLRMKLFTSGQHFADLEQSVRERKTARVHSFGTPVASIYALGTGSLLLPASELEKAFSRAAQTWLPILEKRLEILDTIITAAPLMGLLGTITGMMASFQVLSSNGVNEPSAITGGVAEALIATATGLIIALISLVFYNYFNSQVKRSVEQMENLANAFLELKSEIEKSA